ncbi:uncharacterized protein LOC134254286 [Saccostrea cucullata]|uniref:uncharacterized protein LOC134254286 n=1 Tax=Saccostrea cuccullata TaxID=36930 RepID=UPI002ECFFAA0
MHDDGEEFPLLKTSVGVVEAKQLSLVLTNNNFKTVCYEEPDRGMHPQMIERMKEVLQKKCKDKTVIIVTHSPVFIDSLSVKNTFVFYKEDSSERCTCGLKAFGSEEVYPIVQKLSQDETLKKLFLSSRILIVEGKSDQIVIGAIFRHFFATQESSEKFNKILSHQILQLGGCTNASDVQAVCRKINLPCRTILDRDTYVDVDGQGLVEGFTDIKDFDTLKESTIGEFLTIENGFKKLSK